EKIKQRLEPVLESIEAAEQLRAQIDTLPSKDKIEPDSKQQHQLYLDLKAEYDSLSENEKKMVGDEKKTVLTDTGAALTSFKIVSGHNGWYVKNSGKTLTFKANGPVELELDNGKSISFKAVLVGGKEINETYYEIVAGSTYVTLKTGYLASLANGRYSIQLVYDYMGSEKTTDVAYFTVSNTPRTGDAAQLGLFGTVMFISLAAAGGIYLFLRRKKNEE
ncbi:MAG: LPXTG cell wall anchor domain-containing protein, partial [Oscillospiraceae bacterium]|nr:LPXTG cell wall anchor domain-containing protein [Oscillospiraceae bacterium]